MNADYLFPVLPSARPAFLSGATTNASSVAASSSPGGAAGGIARYVRGGGGGGGRSKWHENDENDKNDKNGNNDNQRFYPAEAGFGGGGAPLFARRSFEEEEEEEEEEHVRRRAARRAADGDYRHDLRALRLQLRESSEQLSVVENINDDLERRLEQLAHRHVEDVRQKDGQLSVVRRERDDAREDAARWQREHDLQVKRRDRAREALRRVEQELYRMHLRKYTVGASSSDGGGGGSAAASANSISQQSQLPAGFPVPREVSLLVSSPAKRRQAQQDAATQERLRARMASTPCSVHGRVGCPCSALAFENNQAAGLESLADFLGLDEGSDEDEDSDGDGGHGMVGRYESASSLARGIINRSPPPGGGRYGSMPHPDASSPGGVSLHGLRK
jgi:hypothetical protein